MLEETLKHFCAGAICAVMLLGMSSIVSGQQFHIPSWVKNNAKWWYEGKIGNPDFVKGIQYLIQNDIMTVPPVSPTIAKEDMVPIWVKNDAGWWANGTISDSDFVKGIQYLIYSGVIHIEIVPNSTTANPESQCYSLATPADKETCLQQIEYENRMRNSIASSTPYAIGPVTFYYAGSELLPADDGKSILTIHFVVKDNAGQEITMSCQNQNSCDYALSDGGNEIPYATNTLVYGSLTLSPDTPKFVDWTFYDVIDTAKHYSFLVKEPWGTGSIPIKIQ
ncbi:MAG: hypothetical protein KGI27_09010 [Thaumarchaeota archaeon]|nr:hypothetical protein [Nitrososphaerota archaeon]